MLVTGGALEAGRRSGKALHANLGNLGSSLASGNRCGGGSGETDLEFGTQGNLELQESDFRGHRVQMSLFAYEETALFLESSKSKKGPGGSCH